MKTIGSRTVVRRLATTGGALVLAVGTGVLAPAGAGQAVASTTTACPAPVIAGSIATVTCGYTGAAQYWTVPAGVTQATFTLYGAAGGTNTEISAPGGAAAEVTGTLTVTPGSRLQVNVGQAGPISGTAFGGGGRSRGAAASGGGASDIRDGAYKLANRLLVAAGGGGGGADGGGASGGIAAGGAGGTAGSAGGTGASAIGVCDETLLGGDGGGAGTATMGGAGGAGNTSGDTCGGPYTPPNGVAGSSGDGGSGGQYGGGGGGGGYYGGGGGAGYAWDSEGPEAGGGGGGGGSSYTGTALDASVNDDPASPPAGGNGEVIITYAEVLTSHSLTGHETAVSCESASLCVAVGSRHNRGVVVTLRNGAQTHALVLRGSKVLDSVSCRPSGCWAIGVPEHGAGAYLVKIGSGGRPSAEQTVAEPAALSLSAISCSSMTDCGVAGTDNHVRPAELEIGTWTGTRTHLHGVAVSGSSRVYMGSISCWHGDCEATAAAQVGLAVHGLIEAISAGKPTKLNANSGYSLGGISCVSATTCYAAGGGELVTVTDRVASDPQAAPARAIECIGSSCEAAGVIDVASSLRGALMDLTDGTAGPTTIVNDSGGYTAIATRAGIGFIAIGPGPGGSGTVDTVG